MKNMVAIGKTSIFGVFKEYLLMTVGMCIYAFGWIGCILPAHCMGGGASGLSLLIYYLTGEVSVTFNEDYEGYSAGETESEDMGNIGVCAIKIGNSWYLWPGVY